MNNNNRKILLVLVIIILPALVLAHGEEGVNQSAAIIENIVLLLHIITAVFMAWPLYALLMVNERPKLGAPPGDKVDDFMEGIIKKNGNRCFIYQATALITGLYLAGTHSDLGFSALIENWALLGKLIGLFITIGLLSFVIFSLQPKVDRLFAELKNSSEKEKVAGKIHKLRFKRKKIAATCLFVVLTVLLLSVQIEAQFPLFVNLALIALIALFVYRVFKTNVPYGWA